MASPHTVTTSNNHTNETYTTRSSLDLFLTCFRQQSCDSCLSSNHPCSWCETSQVCVPNEHFRDPFAILAPIKYEGICPLAWRERWEMRAKPFSCRCSTMTLMSVVVAVVSTLVGVLVIHLSVLLFKVCRRRWKMRREGWWRPSTYDWKVRRSLLPRWKAKSSAQATEPDSERRPLLHGT